jgi:hypothetical protein
VRKQKTDRLDDPLTLGFMLEGRFALVGVAGWEHPGLGQVLGNGIEWRRRVPDG